MVLNAQKFLTPNISHTKAHARGGASAMCEKEVDCCTTGYHVHKEMRSAATSKLLICTREPSKVVDGTP